MPAVAAAAVAAVAVGTAAGPVCAAAAAEHSRGFPEEDGEAAQTVAAAAETHIAAVEEGRRTAVAEGEAHIVVAAVVVNALFALSVRISSTLRLSQWRRRRTLPWRPAGRSCDDAASQYLDKEMAG